MSARDDDRTETDGVYGSERMTRKEAISAYAPKYELWRAGADGMARLFIARFLHGEHLNPRLAAVREAKWRTGRVQVWERCWGQNVLVFEKGGA